MVRGNMQGYSACWRHFRSLFSSQNEFQEVYPRTMREPHDIIGVVCIFLRFYQAHTKEPMNKCGRAGHEKNR